jgi:hypothetical protein
VHLGWGKEEKHGRVSQARKERWQFIKRLIKNQVANADGQSSIDAAGHLALPIYLGFNNPSLLPIPVSIANILQ